MLAIGVQKSAAPRVRIRGADGVTGRMDAKDNIRPDYSFRSTGSGSGLAKFAHSDPANSHSTCANDCFGPRDRIGWQPTSSTCGGEPHSSSNEAANS